MITSGLKLYSLEMILVLLMSWEMIKILNFCTKFCSRMRYVIIIMVAFKFVDFKLLSMKDYKLLGEII